MSFRNKYPIVVAILFPLVSVSSYASDTNNQRDQSAAQEPELTGNILQLRDSLLFTRRISIDIGFNTASERINVPVTGVDGRLFTNASSGFANSFSLGVRAPVKRLFNIGLTSRWREQSGSSS
jgi:hypothetical protein